MVYTRPFFSLIIPCHNPDAYIDRLFSSLENQGISNNDLVVIVVDDNSDSLDYRKKILNYGFSVLFTQTQTNVHCPGNTRQRGLDLATGEWVFFCDQDDFFEDGSLKDVKDYIQSRNKEIYVVSTNMRFYKDGVGYQEEHIQEDVWLHGKWYSTDNLIKPYNIRFKKDLTTCEDIYFNDIATSQLILNGKDVDVLSIFTYVKVQNSKSISGSEKDLRDYFFDNLADYIIASSDPAIEILKSNNTIEWCESQILMTLLRLYFYYESICYHKGSGGYFKYLRVVKDYLHRIQKEFPKFTIDYIVDYTYSDPFRYERVLDSCNSFSGKFIPEVSYQDFILSLYE